MSRTAFSQVDEYIPDNLIAGNTHPIDTKGFDLAVGTGTLVRGTLINKDGAICNKVGDVIDQPRGILANDATLSSTTITPSLIYISGDFRASEIIVGADVKVADFERELRMLGMFLK
ncbi:hypothetical protein [Cellulosilyticum sp. WCF-2]|uniref:hypothetical protein n=1 Tax=Cellulosilyticum sp. WCF-2 TaxID=2497860 RepID=UPI000F8C9B25|nr:hypothetical protein [Cellulosilyticum sp. WCF-2]QEH68695.1 hypothetical protein EKH84_10020 [Cellulosilyticum sp. WCF-2]